MKTAQIGCTANPRVGGMGRALFDYAKSLSDAGHDVSVYSLPPFPEGDVPFKMAKLKYWFQIGKAAWGAKFDPALEEYDIVHLHLPFFGAADTIAKWKQRHINIPLVATYHMDPVGLGLKKQYFKWWYKYRFKKVADACDAIAVTSRAYAEQSQLMCTGVDIEKCEEIFLRVDTEKFKLRQNQPQFISCQSPYLLFVGALDQAHYFKGVSVLLNAIAYTKDARLVIVGKGDLQESYKNQAAQLRIEDRVHFAGGVPDEELAEWYAGARAMVLPSIDGSEAFGIVLIEAMACGTPVIASDLPGVRTVARRVGSGMLVPPNNEHALSQALEQAWNKTWTENDRQILAKRTQEIYGLSTLADQLIGWYKNFVV